MQKLPIGIQAFEVLRSRGYLYVDKTPAIHQPGTEGMYYFLARPRRFGKSLLVSTLKCLFQGRRELFTGLWIAEQSAWQWQPHPVIVLDFNGIAHDSPQILRSDLTTLLATIAEKYQTSLEGGSIISQFRNLILALQQKTGQPVVVLIDEYDKTPFEFNGENVVDPRICVRATAPCEILSMTYGVVDVDPSSAPV